MHVRILITGILIFFIPELIFAQQSISVKSIRPIVCAYKIGDRVSHIPPPLHSAALRTESIQTKTSNFEITFAGFPPNVAGTGPKAALQYAASIWSKLIASPVVIRISAKWLSLPVGVLAETTSLNVVDPKGSPYLNTNYVPALAEKIAGKNLNGQDPDMVIVFNSNINWFYNTNGNIPLDKMDFVTVALHEIAHGLGINDTFDVFGNKGIVGTTPKVYDLHVENSIGENLFRDKASSSTEMKDQLISKNLYYNSPSAKAALGGVRPKLHAPDPFNSSSSIVHLDEDAFPLQNLNSLMTAVLHTGESIHNPGPVVLGMLADLGWNFVYIEHDKLKDTERVDGNPYNVLVKISSDNDSTDNKFVSKAKLNYSVNGINFLSISFTPTGNSHEYVASLPGSITPVNYTYYISLVDSMSRAFTNPGKTQLQNQQTAQTFFRFKAGPDTEVPVIYHEPVSFVIDSVNNVEISARVTDNLGVKDVAIEYYINNDTTRLLMSLLSENIYKITINIPDTLEIGDEIKYRIIASDLSANVNKNITPHLNFYTIYVSGSLPGRDFYVNNFDAESFDFIGNDFTIESALGFQNPAIHSNHPYASGFGDDINYTYQLQIPIKLSVENPTIRFEEVVLVEPGRPGIAFGDKDFYDYVVVEGSNNHGETWFTFSNGYDARDRSVWINKWNSDLKNGNSLASGNSSLYQKRIINMLENNSFQPGDEVIIRFRMFADNATYGWGWAIDNLSVQAPVFDQPISIYPNPVMDKLVVEVNTGDSPSVQLQLLNAQGQSLIIQTLEVNDQSLRRELNLSDLLGGLYILKIAVGGKVYSRKFVKE